MPARSWKRVGRRFPLRVSRVGSLVVAAIGLCCGSAPAEATVLRPPYLQCLTSDQVMIAWRTDAASPANSVVHFGTVAGTLDQSAFGSSAISAYNPAARDHAVSVGGLLPDTRYWYDVGTVTGGVVAGGTPEHFFDTAPVTGTPAPFTVWVLSDSGSGMGGTVEQLEVRDAMLAYAGSVPPNLLLHLGDIVAIEGADIEYTSNHFAVYADALRHIPFWPSIGNHDATLADSPTQLGPYYEAFMLPAGGEAGGSPSGTEAYYSYDYANAHFIALDSADSSVAPGSAQLQWLVDDIASTAQDWLIAYFHHPPYSKGTHNSDSAVDSGGRLVAMRENVLPILEAGGVDLVLAGHSHTYERSYLMDGAYGYGSSPAFPTPPFATLLADGHVLDTGDGQSSGDGAYVKSAGLAGNQGAVYVVAGHGGAGSGGTGGHPVMYFTEIDYGSCLLSFNGNTLDLVNVRSDGAVTDDFRIIKSGPSVSGACCLPDGSCLGGIAPTTCPVIFAGDYMGNGSSCASVTCEIQPGACCLADRSCEEVADGAECDVLEGVFKGHGTDCVAIVCAPPGVCEDFENGYPLGSEIGDHPGWFADDGPNALDGFGVADSVGLFPGPGLLTWTGEPFDWNAAAFLAVQLQMDFESNGQAQFYDDRIGWMKVQSSSNYNDFFGVRLHEGTGGLVIEGCWDGDTPGDAGGRPTIANLPPIAPSTWYRLRVVVTKLSPTSARIEVTLLELAVNGEPVGTTASGSLDTSRLSNLPGEEMPNAAYFSAPSLWPAFKNGPLADGFADNACLDRVLAPTGACCLDDGSCLDARTLSECQVTLGGLYDGHGTGCGSANCPDPLGACCLADGSCIDNETFPHCEAVLRGVFSGFQSACATTTCEVPGGACCIFGFLCVGDTTQIQCVGDLGGAYTGAGTTCEMGPCTDPPCPWDHNDDDSVGFADLAEILLNWGSCGSCSFDLDGNGNVGFFELTALLLHWGPCP